MTDARVLRLNLPYPPSANRYWEVVPNPPRIVVTRDARSYKRALALSHGCLRPFAGPVRVLRFHAFAPDVRCDLDNCFKVTFDALEGLAWVNDNQVKRIDTVEWWLDKSAPHLELEVAAYARPDLPHQMTFQPRTKGQRRPTPSYTPAAAKEKP